MNETEELAKYKEFLEHLVNIAGVELAQLPAWMIDRAVKREATIEQDMFAKELIQGIRDFLNSHAFNYYRNQCTCELELDISLCISCELEHEITKLKKLITP